VTDEQRTTTPTDYGDPPLKHALWRSYFDGYELGKCVESVQDTSIAAARAEFERWYETARSVEGLDDLRESEDETASETTRDGGLTLDGYQARARETFVDNDNSGPERHARLIHGLVGEAGEVAEKHKKILRGDDDITRSDTADELGDVLWYAALVADDSRLVAVGGRRREPGQVGRP